jgi:hypothetical protein
MNKETTENTELLQMEPLRLDDTDLDSVAGGARPQHNTPRVTVSGVTVCCWG